MQLDFCHSVLHSRPAHEIKEKQSLLLIQNVLVPITWDQNFGPGLLRSIMKQSRFAKDELRLILMKKSQLDSERNNFGGKIQ